MKKRVRGGGLGVTGLVLGIIAVTCGVLAVIFSGVGMHQARLCKRCAKGEQFQ